MNSKLKVVTNYCKAVYQFTIELNLIEGLPVKLMTCNLSTKLQILREWE